MITTRMTFVTIFLLVGGALAREMHVLRRLISDAKGAVVSQSATEPTHHDAETISVPGMPSPNPRDPRKCGLVGSRPKQARARKEAGNVLQTMERQRMELTKSTQSPSVQDRGIFSSSKKSHYTDIELGFCAKMGDAQYKKCLLDEFKGTYRLSSGPSQGTGYTYTNAHGATIRIDDEDYSLQCKNCGTRGNSAECPESPTPMPNGLENWSVLGPHEWVDTDFVGTSGDWVIYNSEGVKHFYSWSQQTADRSLSESYADRSPPKTGWYAVEYDEYDPTHTPTEFRADQNGNVARFLELKGLDLASSEESYASEAESSSEHSWYRFW